MTGQALLPNIHLVRVSAFACNEQSAHDVARRFGFKNGFKRSGEVVYEFLIRSANAFVPGSLRIVKEDDTTLLVVGDLK